MATDRPRSTPTKVCPSCGTRVSENAPRCLVCGHQFVGGGSAKKAAKPAPLGGRAALPELHLSLPIAVGLLALFLIVGGGMTYVALAGTGRVVGPAPKVSPSATASVTPTPTPETPTITPTPQASLTPVSYTVKSGDTCGGIAGIFNVSVQSVVLANNLDATCNLFVGQQLTVPQPTFTSTPVASATLGELESTIAACETQDYVVQKNETLSLIAVTYGVPLDAILQWNGLTSDVAYEGQHLSIPLCLRTFVAGATVTPTIAPPYPAPELLLPPDGGPFDSSNDTIALQWASVGNLRNNEFYQVSIVDITGGQNRHITSQVKDTTFSVPTSFRPTDGKPHVYRWYVVAVAQIGVDADGLPVFITGGPASEPRTFTWTGSGAQATPTQ